MSPPDPTLLRCVLCPTPIIGVCPTCGSTANLPVKAERGLRLANGQHLKVPFCAACLDSATPAMFPAILTVVKARFEALWAQQQTPPTQREAFRADWADWEAVGWADEVAGLEHALAATLGQVEQSPGAP